MALDNAHEVIHVGVDIGYKRDTSAVSAVYHDVKRNSYNMWGHRVFEPPVNIHHTVVALLLNLLDNHQVACIAYDPYQFASEAQRLNDKGYGKRLMEVNQQSLMVEFSNTLQTHINTGTFLSYADQILRSHMLHAAAKHTERGFRIVKLRQAKHIDATIATAMALSSATSDMGYTLHRTYREDDFTSSLRDMP